MIESMNKKSSFDTKKNCFKCNKKFEKFSLKVNQDDMKLAKVVIPEGMKGDERICSKCFVTLQKLQEEENVKKHISDNIIHSKQNEVNDAIQSENESSVNITNKPKFCGKCGISLLATNDFCTGCGSKILQNRTDNKQDSSNLQKFSKAWYVIIIILGIISLLGGFAFSNSYNIIMGIILVSIGFVSLKVRSKSIQQLIGIISIIFTIVSIINLIK